MAKQDRQHVSSGSPWEATIGFSRAVRVGKQVFVAGTAPILPDGRVEEDPAAQAERCLEIILGAVTQLGGGPFHVVRTRIYVTDVAYVEAVGQVHAKMFGELRPAATMLVVDSLADPNWKVEIEADAVLD